MAHHSATKKSIRQTSKRNERNTALRSRIRTAVKKLKASIESKDVETSKTSFIAAQKELDKGVSKGVLKKNTVSRLKSRLNTAIKKLAA